MSSAVDNEVLLCRTLELLEGRLRRIEYILDGDVERPKSDQTRSIRSRIHKIENALESISSRSSLIAEAMQLQTKLINQSDEPPEVDAASGFGPSERLAMVLTEAPAFQATASQLNSVKDLQLPSTDRFTSLVALEPRILQAQQRQTAQASEIAMLRKRSAALILQWHEAFVLSQGKCWAEWDTRIRKAEQYIRREEVKLAKEEKI